MRNMIAVIAALAVGLVASTAMAQQSRPQCDDRDKVLRHLARKYQETPVAGGVTNAGGLVEVLTDGRGDTWSIIVTTPEGISCMVAAGEGWRNMKQASPDPQA